MVWLGLVLLSGAGCVEWICSAEPECSWCVLDSSMVLVGGALVSSTVVWIGCGSSSVMGSGCEVTSSVSVGVVVDSQGKDSVQTD